MLHFSRRIVFALVWAAAACKPPAGRVPERPASPRADASSESSPGGAIAEKETPELRPFEWDGVVVIGSQVGGPGLKAVARLGQRLSVLMAAGDPPLSARVVHADLREEDGVIDEEASFVQVAYGSDDEKDAWERPLLWERAAVSGDEPFEDLVPLEDLALLPARLAVPADMELPRAVPHKLEVRYANALCEADADAAHYTLVRPVTSDGTDPVAKADALRADLRRPRRVVTLRTPDRVLHFVTLARVSPPASGRMFDIPRERTTAFWILEEVAGELKVLHHESHREVRSMNVDASCQLPLRYPIPWLVVEAEGIVQVLTRSSLVRFQRWSLKPDGLTLEATFTADTHTLW